MVVWVPLLALIAVASAGCGGSCKENPRICGGYCTCYKEVCVSIEEVMEMDSDECPAGSCADNPRICGGYCTCYKDSCVGIREAAESAEVLESSLIGPTHILAIYSAACRFSARFRSLRFKKHGNDVCQ